MAELKFFTMFVIASELLMNGNSHYLGDTGTDTTTRNAVLSSRCSRIYNGMLMIRRNILKNPTVRKVWPGMVYQIENVIDVINVPQRDREGWKKVACEISEARTLQDLSRATNYPIKKLRVFNGDPMEFSFMDFDAMHVELKAMKRWISRTGFPDVWPLRETSVRRNRRMLEATPTLSQEIVRFYLNWDITDSELAKMLYNRSFQSLDQYISALTKGRGTSRMIKQNIQSNLNLARALATEDTYKDIMAFLKVYENSVLIIKHDLLHLWRE